MDAVGIRTFFSMPISVFVFDTLYIPTGCIKLVVGALHPFSLSFPGYGSVSRALLAEDRLSRNVNTRNMSAFPPLKLRINTLLFSSLLS